MLDHGAYAWRVDEWRGRPWHEAVIYELHVGLFGSYAEVEHFLPRLVELGVTAVELMPLGEFPGRRNWGYDGVLPNTWAFAPLSSIADVNPRSFCPLPSAVSQPVHFVPMSAVTEEFGGIDISARRPLGDVRHVSDHSATCCAGAS